MALQDFALSGIGALFFIAAMLIVFGGQPNNSILSEWSNPAFQTPGVIGPTDTNTNLGGEPYATQTSSGLIADNNPFLNLLNFLGIIPKVVFTLQSAANAFADLFSFLPPEVIWGIGMPLLAIFTIGIIYFLLTAQAAATGARP